MTLPLFLEFNMLVMYHNDKCTIISQYMYLNECYIHIVVTTLFTPHIYAFFTLIYLCNSFFTHFMLLLLLCTTLLHGIVFHTATIETIPELFEYNGISEGTCTHAMAHVIPFVIRDRLISVNPRSKVLWKSAIPTIFRDVGLLVLI